MIKLKEIAGIGFMMEKKKGVLPDDEVVVPNIGKMLYKQLENNVEGKAQNLASKINRHDYDKITDTMLETFCHLVRVARAYKTGGKVPLSTMFKE